MGSIDRWTRSELLDNGSDSEYYSEYGGWVGVGVGGYDRVIDRLRDGACECMSVLGDFVNRTGQVVQMCHVHLYRYQ